MPTTCGHIVILETLVKGVRQNKKKILETNYYFHITTHLGTQENELKNYYKERSVR